MAEDRLFVRRHTNGWHSIVHQFPDGTFSAGGIRQFGAIAHKGIHGLKQAIARADGDVLAKAPHSCDTEKCEPWPENP